MDEGDTGRAQPLGAGGRDVVGSEHIQHSHSQAAYEHRDDADRGAQTRQQEGVQVFPERCPVAADGEPVQVDRKQDDQDDAEPERGHPKTHEREQPHGVVAGPVLVCRGECCQWHRNDDREERRDEYQ